MKNDETIKSIRISVHHKGVDIETRNEIEKTLEQRVPGLKCTGGGTMLLDDCESDSSYQFELSLDTIIKIYKELGYLPTKIRFY